AALLVSIAGLVVVAELRGGAPTREANGPVVAPANAPIAAPAPPAMKRDDRPADARARIHEALAAFVTWSRSHAGEPGPSARDLAGAGDAHALEDPWGHALAITCTDQPADQLAGAVSAGPDGVFETGDDVKSWLLGREVTDLVQGTRWNAAA